MRRKLGKPKVKSLVDFNNSDSLIPPKMERIEALGAHVVRNPSKIGEAVHRAMQ